MELTEPEHAVVAKIWGEGVPTDLREVETDLLWEMHEQISDAVQISHEGGETESLEILLPLETKIARVLYERL